jgi:hypothetical protein
MDIASWHEVESEVYRPGNWVAALLIGTFFLLVGAIAFIIIGRAVPPGAPFWIAELCTGVCAFLGGAVVASVLGSIISPARIRCAAPDVLPNIPKEPLIRKGLVAHGRLTHELCEDAQGWQLRPAERIWRNDKVGLSVFGFLLLGGVSAGATWAFHNEFKIGGWPISVLCGTLVVVLCGGIPLVLLALGLRSGYRHLYHLTIPRNRTDLELDSLEGLNDLEEGLKSAIVGEAENHRLIIPRVLVVAVQLCPMKYRTANEIGLAVQGLLVLESSEGAVYRRLPILLTIDVVGAARLMQRLAEVLRVPYLFSADADGWKAEEIRAESRSPLRIGSQS